MTKGCPVCSCSFCATMRAAMSVAWPGGQGTITLTAWLGYGCATAAAVRKNETTASSAFMDPPPRTSAILERAGVGTTVHEEVLSGDEARLRAAQIGARVAELLDRAEAAGGIGLRPRLRQFGRRLAEFFGVEFKVGAQAVGVKGTGKQRVDGDVMAHRLARKSGDEPGEPGARAIGQSELRDRILHGARGDVDDAPEAPRDHAVDYRLDELDRRQHVGIQRLHPVLPRPGAEIPGRRAAGVVHQDVWRGTRLERRRASFGGGDIARNRIHFDLISRTNLRCGGVERFLAARRDDEIHALARERDRAALAKSLRCRAHERGLAAYTQVHVQPFLRETRRTPPISSTAPAIWRGPNGSPRPSALITATLTGLTAPTRANSLAPMRRSASAWRKSGSTVLTVARMTAYAQTFAGRSSALDGSSAKNWTSAGAVATAML